MAAESMPTMFVVRCAFWLSVVYAALLWRGTGIDATTSLVDATRDTARTALSRATLDVARACGERSAGCLDAADLTSLVRAAAGQERDGSTSDDPQLNNGSGRASRRQAPGP